jgi:hypothetical protein
MKSVNYELRLNKLRDKHRNIILGLWEYFFIMPRLISETSSNVVDQIRKNFRSGLTKDDTRV